MEINVVKTCRNKLNILIPKRYSFDRRTYKLPQRLQRIIRTNFDIIGKLTAEKRTISSKMSIIEWANVPFGTTIFPHVVVIHWFSNANFPMQSLIAFYIGSTIIMLSSKVWSQKQNRFEDGRSIILIQTWRSQSLGSSGFSNFWPIIARFHPLYLYWKWFAIGMFSMYDSKSSTIMYSLGTPVPNKTISRSLNSY
jgi:hypothetical protein